MNSDAARWNERYSDQQKWDHKEPKRLLLDYIHLLPNKGTALDAACGTGINGLVLADRGYDVISYDVAFKALTLAKVNYANAGKAFLGAAIDIKNIWLPQDCFDVILNFSFLERDALPQFHRSLKTGGYFFFETLLKYGEYQSAHYLDDGEADAFFVGYDIIHRDTRQFFKNGLLHKISDQVIARKH